MSVRRGALSFTSFAVLLCLQGSLPVAAIADEASPFGNRPQEVDLDNAYHLPSVFVDRMDVRQEKTNATGMFSVVNDDNEIVGNLRYRIELYGDMPGVDPTGDPAVLYRVTEAKDLPSLAPGVRVSESFTADLAGIPDGSYKLRVQLIHGRGRLLGWNNQFIVIRNGAPAYVGVYGASITLPEFGGKSVDALTGPNLDPNGTFSITALTENTGAARTLTPRLRLYAMDFSEEVVDDIRFAPVTIASGESTFDLMLTAPEKAGVYAGTLELMDGDTVVSSIGEYRIVVRGMDADILSSRLANSVSKKGDTAFVRIEHVGASDAETRGAGVLNVAISDDMGVAGMVTIPSVPLSDGVAIGTAKIELLRNLAGSPRLTVRILSSEDGSLLAKQTSAISTETLEAAAGASAALWMEWYMKPGSVFFFASILGMIAALAFLAWSLRSYNFEHFRRPVAGLAIAMLLLIQIQPAIAQEGMTSAEQEAVNAWRATLMEDMQEDFAADNQEDASRMMQLMQERDTSFAVSANAKFGGNNGIEVFSPITVGENVHHVSNPVTYFLNWKDVWHKPIVEIFVNKPIHNSTIKCEGEIDLEVRVNYASCNNELSAVRVIGRLDLNGKKQSTLEGSGANWKEVFDQSYTQPIGGCSKKSCIHSRTFSGKISLSGLKSGATETTLQVVAKHNPFFDGSHQVPNDTVDLNDEYFKRKFVQAFNIWLMCEAPKKADITIKKDATSQVNRGDKITYDLVVKNIGDSNAENVTVTDAIPSGLSYVDSQSDSRCNQSGNNVVCQLGTLNKGQSTNVRIVMQTSNSTACGNVHNVASVATTTPESNLNNNQDDADTNVVCASSSSSSKSSSKSSSSPPPPPPSSSSKSSVGVGCIDILKEAYDPFGNPLSVVPQFQFKLDGGQTYINGSNGRVTISNVTPGTHTITETVPSGWTMFNVTPANGVVSVVAGNSCAGVVFKNRQNPASSSSSSSSSAPRADVFVQKSGPASVNQGSNISYSLIIKNNGPDTAQNVVVTDAIPSGVTYIDSQSDSRCNQSGNNVVCQLGTMTNQQQTSLTIMMQTSTQTTCGPVTNVASVSTTTQETNSSNNQSSFQTQVLCPQGCIEILKEAFDPFGSPLSVVPQFQFKLDGGQTYINGSNGRVTISNVTPGTHTVTEMVPAGWTMFNVTPINGVVTVVGGGACAGVVFKNQQNSVSSSSSSSSTPQADVAIVKLGGPPVNRGDSLTYSLQATNNGLSAAAGVVVSDPVPAGLTYIDSLSDSRCDLNTSVNTVFCSLGTLTAGQSTSINLTFQSSAQTACGLLGNTASISTDTQDTNLNNNQSHVDRTVLCPSSSSSSSSSSSVGLGCIEVLKEAFNPSGQKLGIVPQFQFLLNGQQTAINDSTGYARFFNVPAGTHTVTETIPAGWNQFLVTPTNGTVTVVEGNACAGVVFKNQQLPLSSSSSISSSSVSSSSSSTSSGIPDIVVQKSGPVSAQPNTQITYTITVNNTGTAPAQNVIVNDVIPAGTTYVSSSGANCTLNGSTLSCQLGTVNVNEPRTISLTVLVNASVACNSVIVNTATVTTTSSDSNASNNTTNQVNTLVQCVNQTGCIEVTKQTYDQNGNQIFNVPSFTFTLDGNRTATNDSNGRARFDNVPVGTHTVIETVRSDWRLESVSPSNGTVNVAAGNSCAQVQFRNRQDEDDEDFTISKTDGETEVDQGDELTYTIRVRNNSNRTVNNVTVTDTLPDEVDFQSCTRNCSRSGRFITWSNQTFSANEERIYEVEVDVDEDADGTLLNTAQVFNRTATDRTDVRDDDDDEDIEADLTKTSDVSEVFPGGIVTYTVTVRNTGDEDLRDVVVEDVLPPEMIVLDDGDADEHNGNRLIWEIGDLDEGDDWSVTYRTTVSTSAFPGQILSNKACVEDEDNEIDECETRTVAVIGNLPQTGVFSGITGSAVKLRPIRLGGSPVPTGSSDPFAPLAAWISIAGLGVGLGMGAGRRLLIGF